MLTFLKKIKSIYFGGAKCAISVIQVQTLSSAMVKLSCSPIIFVVLTLLAVNFVKAEKNDNLGRGDNGGIPCAACTILLSISSQLAQIYNETTVESLERLCTFLPETYKGEKS